MNKKGQFGVIITIGSVIFLISTIIFYLLGLHVIITEDGSHTGYVTSIETNGIIFKTYSVYFKTETESSQEDRYCIIDEELKNKLAKYQKEKKLITIEFFDWIIRGVKYCKSGDIAIISGVEE